LLEAEHQLRQPLNAISLLVSELRQGASGRDLDAVIADLRYAVDLSNVWLTSLADLEKADCGLLDLHIQNVALRDVFAPLREEFSPRLAHLGLDFRVVEAGAVVRADPVLLRCVIALLLDNAAKFTRDGKILLGCRRTTTAEGGGIRIEVWDSGFGVAEEEKHRLFEPFFRLDNEARPRERGLGLGLAYAARLVALAGDALTVTSKLGRGSCFALTLREAGSSGDREIDNGGPDSDKPRGGMPANPLEDVVVALMEGPDAATLLDSLLAWGACPQLQPAEGLAAALDGGAALVIADEAVFAGGGGWDLLGQARPRSAPAVILVTDRAAEKAGEPPPAAYFLKRPVKLAQLRSLCHYALSRRGS
jgi:anti-sigma regulatory factor (Ser/Thr protein kinase)